MSEATQNALVLCSAIIGTAAVIGPACFMLGKYFRSPSYWEKLYWRALDRIERLTPDVSRKNVAD